MFARPVLQPMARRGWEANSDKLAELGPSVALFFLLPFVLPRVSSRIFLRLRCLLHRFFEQIAAHLFSVIFYSLVEATNERPHNWWPTALPYLRVEDQDLVFSMHFLSCPLVYLVFAY